MCVTNGFGAMPSCCCAAAVMAKNILIITNVFFIGVAFLKSTRDEGRADKLTSDESTSRRGDYPRRLPSLPLVCLFSLAACLLATCQIVTYFLLLISCYLLLVNSLTCLLPHRHIHAQRHLAAQHPPGLACQPKIVVATVFRSYRHESAAPAQARAHAWRT